jgi:hypothetical protein
VRLAEQNGAGGAQAAHDLVVLRRRAAVPERAARADLARDVGVVLDRDRHAVERRRAVAAARVGRAGRSERLAGEHDPVAAEERIQAVDPPEVELGQLARRDLARADQLGLAPEAGEGEVGWIHGADPSARATA